MKYVYLLRVGQKHYKVGVANNVYERVKSLQTSNPNVIEIVSTKLVEEAYEIEHQFHDYLAQFKAEGGKEWFEMSAEQAVALAILINRAPSVDITQQIRLRTILADQDKKQRIIQESLDLIDKKLSKIKSVELKQAQPSQETTDAETPMEIAETIDQEEVEYQDALLVAQHEGQVSTSMLQRRMKIGYGKASRLVDRMQEEGYIGPPNGIKARKFLK